MQIKKILPVRGKGKYHAIISFVNESCFANTQDIQLDIYIPLNTKWVWSSPYCKQIYVEWKYTFGASISLSKRTLKALVCSSFIKLWIRPWELKAYACPGLGYGSYHKYKKIDMIRMFGQAYYVKQIGTQDTAGSFLA